MLFNNKASCEGLESDIFFPDEASHYQYLSTVKKMCDNCSAKLECFDYAIENAVQGIWAGTTFNERDAYRLKHGIVAKGVVPNNLVYDHIA